MGHPSDRSIVPDLSVIVVVHNMTREAPRTLLSLSTRCQREIAADEYEVIVVDNGSAPPLDPAMVEQLPGHFRLIRIDPAPPSPAYAVNRGLAAARGRVIGVMVDGARLVTPGLLHFARHGVALHARAVVATLGWYLGQDYQSLAVKDGYDAAREDALLDGIRWPEDGYRLFEVSTLGEASLAGWFPELNASSETLSESNALFLSRESWDALGGYDERFDLPGGGFVNLDTFRRALELPDARLVLLLGEATFHQVHGGTATNAPPEVFRTKLREWMVQYMKIRGRPWTAPTPAHPPTYLGPLPRAALARFVRGAIDPVRRNRLQPLGPAFDLWSWPDPPSPRSADPVIAALVDLMRTEFHAGRYDAVAVIARLARAHAPHAPEPLRILPLVAPYFDEREWKYPAPRGARFHLAVGKALLAIGERERASAAFRAALDVDPDLTEARELAGSPT